MSQDGSVTKQRWVPTITKCNDRATYFQEHQCKPQKRSDVVLFQLLKIQGIIFVDFYPCLYLLIVFMNLIYNSTLHLGSKIAEIETIKQYHRS